MEKEQIKRNLILIKDQITKSCKLHNRQTSEVNLIAVSKKFGSEKIIEAIKCNVGIFGENYVKEAQEKWPEIKKRFPEVKLHFIGHLQSNKAAEAVALFDCIETVDREKLAKEIKKEADKQRKNPEILIQVNIGEEEQKSGILPQNLNNFVKFVRDECKLNVTGLMCIPPENENPSPYFALLHKMARENELQKLSMGMSADFEDAIALGATHIRIGSAIFGNRKQK